MTISSSKTIAIVKSNETLQISLSYLKSSSNLNENWTFTHQIYYLINFVYKRPCEIQSYKKISNKPFCYNNKLTSLAQKKLQSNTNFIEITYRWGIHHQTLIGWEFSKANEFNNHHELNKYLNYTYIVHYHVDLWRDNNAKT